MHIYDFTPFDVSKHLWHAYAAHAKNLEPHEYFILRDADTIYTTPHYGELIYYHVSKNPHIKCFTCWTNRIGCDFQKDLNAPPGNDYELHRQHGAMRQKNYFNQKTDVTEMGTMSGFWMCIKKELWDKLERPKTKRILDLDTSIHRQVRALGERIWRLDGLYIYHFYSNYDGVGNRNISHLL